jgi:Protein of unknown function (DUF3037)
VPESTADPFSYAVVRVVPDVERGESFNAGVIVHCPARDFLDARVKLDEGRLRALAPDADVPQIRAWLDSVVATARGEGPGSAVAKMSRSDRFGLLTAPSSTVIQTSPVHTGLTRSPEQELDHLFARLVD